jgi:hypothetical protein
MRLRSLLQALLLCIGIASSAQASLNITIGDLALSPGGTGYVNVSLSGEGDLLAAFYFEFLISPASGATSRLQFVNPQPDPQLTDPEYVFFGNSLNVEWGSPVGSVLDIPDPGATFVGGDATSDGKNVAVTGEKLLARLEVTHVVGQDVDPTTTIGHTFDVTLEPGSFFEDASGASLGYTPTAAQVTIIPEPSQLTIMLGLGGIFLVGSWWRRRKRSAGA